MKCKNDIIIPSDRVSFRTRSCVAQIRGLLMTNKCVAHSPYKYRHVGPARAGDHPRCARRARPGVGRAGALDPEGSRVTLLSRQGARGGGDPHSRAMRRPQAGPGRCQPLCRTGGVACPARPAHSGTPTPPVPRRPPSRQLFPRRDPLQGPRLHSQVPPDLGLLHPVLPEAASSLTPRRALPFNPRKPSLRAEQRLFWTPRSRARPGGH